MRLIILLFGHPGSVLGRPCVFCNALGSFWAAVGNTLVFVDSDDFAFWMPLGASWAVLEVSWGMMGASSAVFGGRPGASWGSLLHMGARAGPPLRQKTFAIVACLSRIRKLLETQRPESENIGNPAGIYIFSIFFWGPRNHRHRVLDASCGFLGRLGGVLGHDWAVLGRLWGASWGTFLHMGARAGPPLRQKTLAIVGDENCWKTYAPKAKILEILQEFVYL